jgi:hypothetical protein
VTDSPVVRSNTGTRWERERAVVRHEISFDIPIVVSFGIPYVSPRHSCILYT